MNKIILFISAIIIIGSGIGIIVSIHAPTRGATAKYQDSVNWKKEYWELKEQVTELLYEHKRLKKYFKN